MHVELQNLDIAMKVQASVQNKALDQQANVLQLIDGVAQAVEPAARPSDGVRGRYVDISA